MQHYIYNTIEEVALDKNPMLLLSFVVLTLDMVFRTLDLVLSSTSHRALYHIQCTKRLLIPIVSLLSQIIEHRKSVMFEVP